MTIKKFTDLKSLLKEKAEGETLFYNVERIKKCAEPLLAKIVEVFPEYTIHDVRHSEQVLIILNWLIPESLKVQMNSYEIFFLIASSYLHDIGMVNFPELFDEKLGKNADEIRNNIRKNHHVRSEKFIINNYLELGIENEHQARIIGRICRGHREALMDNKMYNNREMYTSRNIPINVPFLSALLQIADDLDLSFERTPFILYKTIKPKNDLSLREWDRHLSTCGVGLDSENKARIIISAKCSNSDIHRSLKQLELLIQDKLDFLPDVLFQYRNYVADLPQRVLVMIETIGYEAEDFKFSLQEREITSILMGARLYDRKECALRELLQNSYDACRFRLLFEKNIKPKIVFQLSEDRSKLLVKDNGIGMDRKNVERYFTRIGKCFYKSPEFSEFKDKFNPISTFGIGILSCFMISDHIIVETKAKESPPIIIEIFGVDDYFLVKPGSRSDTGTTITLFLKKEVKETLNLENELTHYARYLDFPIDVIDEDGNKKQITSQNRLPTVDSFIRTDYRHSTEKIRKKFSFITFKLKQKNIEGIISFLVKNTEIGPVPVTLWDDYRWIKDRNEVVISYEGIYVNEINEILPQYFNRRVHIDINLHGDIIDLNVSRTGLVANEKHKELTSTLEKAITDCFKQWINIEEKKQGFRPHLRNAICTNYIDDEIISTYRYSLPKNVKASKTFINFLRDIFCFHVFTKNKDFFIPIRDLSKTGKRITLLTNDPLREESFDYVVDLIKYCDSFKQGDFYVFDKWRIKGILKVVDEENKIITSEKSFKNMFKIEKMTTPIKYLFPKTWRLVRFKNLKTDRMFEILTGGCGSDTYINVENGFIALLLKHPDVVMSNPEKRAIIESFFIQLKRNLKGNYGKVLEMQKRILNWYQEAGKITSVKPYILTKKHLPHHYR